MVEVVVVVEVEVGVEVVVEVGVVVEVVVVVVVEVEVGVEVVVEVVVGVVVGITKIELLKRRFQMIGWLVIVLLTVNGIAGACSKGCIEYQGTCACDQAAEKSVQTFQPSNEKPPRSGMAAWQAEGIKADMPQSMIYQDAQADQKKLTADFEGKVAAGIKP